MRERSDFRDNYADVLEFFGGKRLLNLKDVRDYTGLKDNRTVKKKFPFMQNGNISIVSFARALCSEGTTR